MYKRQDRSGEDRDVTMTTLLKSFQTRAQLTHCPREKDSAESAPGLGSSSARSLPEDQKQDSHSKESARQAGKLVSSSCRKRLPNPHDCVASETRQKSALSSSSDEDSTLLCRYLHSLFKQLNQRNPTESARAWQWQRPQAAFVRCFALRMEIDETSQAVRTSQQPI